MAILTIDVKPYGKNVISLTKTWTNADQTFIPREIPII